MCHDFMSSPVKSLRIGPSVTLTNSNGLLRSLRQKRGLLGCRIAVTSGLVLTTCLHNLGSTIFSVDYGEMPKEAIELSG